MKSKERIIKTIVAMAGRHSAYEIFSDWVEMCAISIQNNCMMIHNKLWEQREQQYLNIAGKYNHVELMMFCEMFQLLGDAFEEGMSDILGEIYMESGSGSKAAGQFFTPYHVSLLTAQMGIPNDVSEEAPYQINELSAGAGGMIIAAAQVLRDRGLNYQRCMEVVAQDIDRKAVHMTYVQLSLLGIKATVVQGSTLTEPYAKGYPKERIFYTPAKMGLWI